MATVTAGPGMGLNMAAFDADGLANGDVVSSSTTQVTVTHGTAQDVFTGAFVLGADGQAMSGTLNGVTEQQSGAQAMQITGLSLNWAQALEVTGTGEPAQVLGFLLSGSDNIAGSGFADVL